MRRTCLFALFAFAAMLVQPANATPGDDIVRPAGAELVEGRYIVVLNDDVATDSTALLHRAVYGVEITHVYEHALKGYAAAMSESTAQVISALPAVDWVEQDHRVYASAQPLPTGIDRIQGELSPTARINGVDERVNVDVAVIDTGIDLAHPDLNVYRAGGKNCVTSFLAPNDLNGHGSHVAGTIGAIDNTVGVVGVAPGARVWPIKVLTDVGTGLNSAVICGVNHVTSRAGEIEVANMSLGGGGSDDNNCGNSNNDAYHRAVCSSVQAGVTVVVAAGNDSVNASTTTPAAYDEVITVSALADFNGAPGGGGASTCTNDVDDTFANYSNFGADVDLIAPGTCIRSTYMNGGYSTISGTSMASPHVAGAAALYKSVNPGATPAQVKSVLQSTGGLDWVWPSQDPDGIQERLLNVSTL